MKAEEFKRELLRLSACTQELFRKLIIPVCQRFDLTPQQLFILTYLYRENYQTPRQISEQIGINPSNFSSVIKRLEADSYVQRVKSQTDKRMSVLRLTGKGKNLLEIIEQETDRQYGDIFAQIPDELSGKISGGLDALHELSLYF